MARPEDFCRTWTFKNAPEVQKAYPEGGTVTIGRQYEEGKQKFMLAWTDMDGDLHVLTELTLHEHGYLHAAEGSPDLATGRKWRIRIYHSNNTDHHVIEGTVAPADPIHEGDLSGNWGAEAPPREGEG